eukprot:8237720-Pyramimonas_sp.AAC.1
MALRHMFALNVCTQCCFAWCFTTCNEVVSTLPFLQCMRCVFAVYFRNAPAGAPGNAAGASLEHPWS